MYFQIKMPEKGSKNIFTGNQTIKQVPLMFLDNKVLSEKYQLRFWTMSTNKERAVYVFNV